MRDQVIYLSSLLPAVLLASCGDPFGPKTQEDYLTPVLVSSTLTFTDIAASGHHTCAIATDGTTYCWGKNEYGELGTSAAMQTCDGSFPCTGTPVAVTGAPRFAAVVASQGHTCALTAEGKAYCWGFGLGGQLGSGSRTNSTTPVPVAGGLEFERLRTGASRGLTCGIARDGHTYCWGVGQFGNGGADGAEPTPTRITGELRFTSIDLGASHACGLTAEGKAYCWGGNWYGTLGVGSAGGDGGLAQTAVPLPVVGYLRFRQIVTGGNQTCGLTEAGVAYCWGATVNVGFPATTWVVTPQPVAGGHTYASLHAGFLHTCGLTAAGEAYCWGQNFAGELGDGSRTDRQMPVKVKTNVRFASLSHRPHCGLTPDGRAYCWGSNPYGQVGRRGHRAGG